MNNIRIITLSVLLSASIGLQAGCWMPESDTVKNYYEGKDGGYITILASNDERPHYLRLRGRALLVNPPGLAIEKFVKGTLEFIAAKPGDPRLWEKKRILIFVPKKFKKPRGQFIRSSRSREIDTPLWLRKLIKNYWPGLKGIVAYYTRVMDFPCYITTTDKAFEKWKKKSHKSKQQRQEEREEKREEKRKEKREKMREKQEQESEERRREAERKQEVHGW